MLLLARPDGVPLLAALVAGALGAATVGLTVVGAVPLHQRLTPYDDRLAQRLVAVHRWRTGAWTAAALVAGSMIVSAS